MTLNTIAILAILVVFVLIGATVFTLRKPVMEKMMKPVSVFLDDIFEPERLQASFNGFLKVVDEKNKEYHRAFLKSTGVKSQKLP